MKKNKCGKSSASIESSSCMIRHFNGEPRCLYIDSFDDKSIALKATEGLYDKPLWFPREIAFAIDPKLLSDLTAAYREDNQQGLESLWTQAKKWEPMNA